MGERWHQRFGHHADVCQDGGLSAAAHVPRYDCKARQIVTVGSNVRAQTTSERAADLRGSVFVWGDGVEGHGLGSHSLFTEPAGKRVNRRRLPGSSSTASFALVMG